MLIVSTVILFTDKAPLEIIAHFLHLNKFINFTTDFQ